MFFDLTQALLILVIIVLTSFLIIVGVQVYFILKDVRVTLSRLNKVLDNTGVITDKIREPFDSSSSINLGLRAFLSFLNLLRGREK
ncbi:hypothetical protein A2Z23_00320 [Candidatus Curtissbacteria bacterium RBG_16_39_7]|uniref:Uncharacterized protein n=1 Tax=Candidatus Curtissbacteria bacterium RBG_16_39_7 TaxID=1797707 RepID=A0A1F5G391_9BACT|nr:MAG: hypothetical protein A2Z23_00320 [Candidatus Curtissbacteria bacterium RBG_16_39_7]